MLADSGPHTEHSRLNSWRDTNLDEMKKFFGLTVVMGLVPKPKLELYWSQCPETSTPYIPSIMSRNRYQILNSMLHFTDNDTIVARGQPGYDPLAKVRPVLDQVMKRSVSGYLPEKELSVDEHAVPFKGRVTFRVFEQNKPKRFHIRLYMVTEASTGYVLTFQPYTRCPTNNEVNYESAEEAKETTKIVMNLLAKARCLNKGHEVYMDRFYSSPELAMALYNQQTYVCGTVASNRQGMPLSFRPKGTKALPRPKGTSVKLYDTIWRTNSPMCTLQWKDKKAVTMLSTTLGPTACPFIMKRRTGKRDANGRAVFTYERILKPEIILQYNKHKIGVDLAGQRVFNYYIARRGCKWWRKLVLHLFDLQICNAYVLYQKAFAEWLLTLDVPDNDKPHPLTHYAFRLQIARYLIDDKEVGEKGEPRLSRRCFPRQNEARGAESSREIPSRLCHVCRRATTLTGDKSYNHSSNYHCQTCQKTLCVRVHLHSNPPYSCFELYHTQFDYASCRAGVAPIDTSGDHSIEDQDVTLDLNDHTLNSMADLDDNSQDHIRSDFDMLHFSSDNSESDLDDDFDDVRPLSPERESETE